MNEKRCRIGLSTPNGFKFYKNFKSNEELALIVIAALHIPFHSVHESIVNDQPCMDGVFQFERDHFVGDDLERNILIRTVNEEEEGYSHINVAIPSIFLFLPVPDFWRLDYYEKGYSETTKYLENPRQIKKNSSSVLTALSEWFWWLRRIQPIYSQSIDLLKYIAEPT